MLEKQDFALTDGLWTWNLKVIKEDKPLLIYFTVEETDSERWGHLCKFTNLANNKDWNKNQMPCIPV